MIRYINKSNGIFKIFIVSAERLETLKDTIKNDIAAIDTNSNISLYYCDSDPTNEELYFIKKAVNLCVLPFNYEYYNATINNALHKQINFFTEAGVPIIPVQCVNMPGKDIIIDSKIQTINRFSLPYEDYLNVLRSAIDYYIDDSLNDSSCFSNHIFLSYRKRDRKLALELIQKIHNDPLLWSVNVWFDDYLIYGEDFNKKIKEEIERCDCFILLVTDNLISPDNYVLTKEYPLAVQLHKTIIAVSLSDYNEHSFFKIYKNINKVDDIRSEKKERKFLSELNEILCVNEEHINYSQISRCYLLGQNVEKNADMARNILEKGMASGEIESYIAYSDISSNETPICLRKALSILDRRTVFHAKSEGDLILYADIYRHFLQYYLSTDNYFEAIKYDNKHHDVCETLLKKWRKDLSYDPGNSALSDKIDDYQRLDIYAQELIFMQCSLMDENGIYQNRTIREKYGNKISKTLSQIWYETDDSVYLKMFIEHELDFIDKSKERSINENNNRFVHLKYIMDNCNNGLSEQIDKYWFEYYFAKADIAILEGEYDNAVEYYLATLSINAESNNNLGDDYINHQKFVAYSKLLKLLNELMNEDLLTDEGLGQLQEQFLNATKLIAKYMHPHLKQCIQRSFEEICSIIITCFESIHVCPYADAFVNFVAVNLSTAETESNIYIKVKETIKKFQKSNSLPVQGKSHFSSTVFFGKYRHSLNSGNSAIEWIVLDQIGNKLLLISKYAIEGIDKQYCLCNDGWIFSGIREWLNNAFLQTAFSHDEITKIQFVKASEETSILLGENYSHFMTDRIFLLSQTEINHYFPTEESRTCVPTELAISKNIETERINGKQLNCSWAIRYTEDLHITSLTVNCRGQIEKSEFSPYPMLDLSDDDNVAIRPAMWITI